MECHIIQKIIFKMKNRTHKVFTITTDKNIKTTINKLHSGERLSDFNNEVKNNSNGNDKVLYP